MIDGALVEVEGRPAIRFARPLAHSAERVWRAITDPDELARWFVAPVTWKPELGETWEAMGHQGEITKLEAPSELSWSWGEERYSFEIIAGGEKCLLIFTHVFSPELGPADQHAAGWETYLARLDAHLDGGYLSEEDAHQRFEELHSDYLELFGSKLPVELADGGVLRLRRRLAHSPERVWRAITDEGDLENWFPLEGGMEVVESEPQRLLVAIWFGDRLRFELEPDGDGCRLTFSHEFSDAETSARTAAGWDRCFVRFEAVLDGEPINQSESLRGWPAVHERFASAFGVDPSLGRETFVGHAES